MGIHYVGNCEWRQVGSPEWSVGSYGEDRATVRWLGRADKEKAFQDSLAKFKTLGQPYQMMFLDTWRSSSAKPYLPEVSVEYVGFRRGQIPPVKAVNTTSSQQAQGEGEDTASNSPYYGNTISGTLFYHASRTNYEWWEISQPADFPKYGTVQNKIDPFLRVYSYSLKTGPPSDPNARVSIHNAPTSSLVAAFRSLVRIEQWGDYNREPVVEGKLWHCSCSVDYILQ